MTESEQLANHTERRFRNCPGLTQFRAKHELDPPLYLSVEKYELELARLSVELKLAPYTCACIDALVELYCRSPTEYGYSYSIDLLYAAFTLVSKLSDHPRRIGSFYTVSFSYVMVIIEFELARLCWENQTGLLMALWN